MCVRRAVFGCEVESRCNNHAAPFFAFSVFPQQVFLPFYRLAQGGFPFSLVGSSGCRPPTSYAWMAACGSWWRSGNRHGGLGSGRPVTPLEARGRAAYGGLWWPSGGPRSGGLRRSAPSGGRIMARDRAGCGGLWRPVAGEWCSSRRKDAAESWGLKAEG